MYGEFQFHLCLAIFMVAFIRGLAFTFWSKDDDPDFTGKKATLLAPLRPGFLVATVLITLRTAGNKINVKLHLYSFYQTITLGVVRLNTTTKD